MCSLTLFQHMTVTVTEDSHPVHLIYTRATTRLHRRQHQRIGLAICYSI